MKRRSIVAISIGVCVFLLCYIIPILFTFANWFEGQALCVQAGVVSALVSGFVFVIHTVAPHGDT